jgi:hypothetical protein
LRIIAPVAPERDAHGDRAAVDVDLLVRHAHLLHELHRHGGEGLVDLEQVDLRDRHAGLGERLARRGHRAGQHDGGIGARERGGDDARARLAGRASRPAASLPTRTAAAPSTMPDELPAWCTWRIRPPADSGSSATWSKPIAPSCSNAGFKAARPSRWCAA